MRALSITTALLALLLALGARAATADDSADGCDTQPLIDFGTGISGNSTLCVTSNDIHAVLRAENMVPGDSYTVWWIYFDKPDECIGGGPGICDVPDVLGDNPLGVLGRFDGAIAPRNGRLVFKSRLRSMQPSSGSLIWLVINIHGPANLEDGRQLARQLLTPEDPMLGAPHLGNIVDGPLGLSLVFSEHFID